MKIKQNHEKQYQHDNSAAFGGTWGASRPQYYNFGIIFHDFVIVVYHFGIVFRQFLIVLEPAQGLFFALWSGRPI